MLINNGRVSDALIELIELQGLAVNKTPQAVNMLLQENWMKAKDGILRHQIGGRLPNEKEFDLLSQMGFLEEMNIDPQIDIVYNPPIFLGATMKAMARRFQFLKKNWKGVDNFISTIYILAGQRPVDKEKEGRDAIPRIIEETGFELDNLWMNTTDWPKTETEVADFLINFGNIIAHCEFIDHPLVNGSAPNTYQTAVALFKRFGESTKHKKWLVVSSQPFCLNQLMTVRRAAKDAGLSNDHIFEVCGPAASPDLPLARILDCVAKQLWEELQ